MPSASSSSITLLLARIFWMMFGPFLLLVFAASLATKGSDWFSPLSIAFLIVLAVIVAARYYEFSKGDSHTSTGEPATLNDLRRYILVILPLGLGIWIAANVIGNYLIAK
jgi:hypothetical protein